MILNKLKNLSLNEKVMLGFIILLILGIAYRWPYIKDGVLKGIKPYKKEQLFKD